MDGGAPSLYLSKVDIDRKVIMLQSIDLNT